MAEVFTEMVFMAMDSTIHITLTTTTEVEITTEHTALEMQTHTTQELPITEVLPVAQIQEHTLQDPKAPTEELTHQETIAVPKE